MRYKSGLRWGLLIATCAGAAGIVAAQPTPPDPVAQVKTQKLNNIDITRNLTWQAEPNGPGEYLPAPNAPLVAPFQWGTQTFVGTAQGLLYSVAGDDAAHPQWKIMPELYGQPARPIGDLKGQLVVESGQPFAEGARGLVILDDQLKIAKELPTVKGYCIGVDPSGFWTLEGMQETPPTAKGPTALVHYDTEGDELGRFTTDGTALPKGQIFWAAHGGPNAIWLAVFSYKGLDKDGKAEWNSRQMVRFDPVTSKGETADITAPGGAGFAMLPEKIVWLEAPPAGQESWPLQQMDKATMAITKAGDITLKGVPDTVSAVNDMTATDKYIWARPVPALPPVAVSAENFAPVPPATAGGWPGYQNNSYTLYASNAATPSSSALTLLAAGEQRAWFAAPEGVLAAVADDGTVKAYSLGQENGAVPAFVNAAAINGNLYLLQASGELWQVAAANGDMKIVSYPRAGFAPSFEASNKRLWFTNSKQITTLAPGEPDRTLNIYKGQGKAPTLNPRQMAAVGQDLYFLQWDDAVRSLVLWRASGDDARRTSVSSWFKEFASIGSRDYWQRHLSTAIEAPDDRVLFFPIYGKTEKITIYDPSRDIWQQVPMERNVVWMARGPKQLVGFDADGTPLLWKGTKWEPLAATAGLKPTGPVFGTAKFLYIPTAIGIYRLAWEKLALESASS